MCLRELFREFVVAKRKAQADRERDICLAYHTAALAGAAFGNKFPKLEDLLTKVRPMKPQNVQQQRQAVAAIAAAYKLPLRQVRRKKTRQKATT